MSQSPGQHYLEDCLDRLRSYKESAEKAFAQVSNEEYFRTLDEEGNSIAVLMKHIAGNMLSRWTDFLTSDGEKPWRDRDLEFVMSPNTSVNEIRDYWERGWECLFAALESLEESDLMRTIKIRGEDHTVVEAI